MDGRNTKFLKLIDAENNLEYEISVTEEEYNRAQWDAQFATQLLVENRQEPTHREIDEYTNESVRLEHNILWTEPATKLFLSLYKEFTDDKPTLVMKVVWVKMAEKMKQHGYNCTPRQCNTKMDSLKRQYKSIKDHNNKSGNSRKTWCYFELMDDIFGSRAWANPLSTMASTSRIEDQQAEEALQKENGQVSRKRKHKDGAVLQDLINLKTNENIARQNRHEEKMQRLDRLNDILEKFVQK